MVEAKARRTRGATMQETVERPPRPATVHPGPHPVRSVSPVTAKALATTGRSELEIMAHYVVGLTPALVMVALFLSAHGLVDAQRPDAGSARTDYVLVLCVGALALAGGAVLAARNGWYALAGVAVGIPMAFWLKDLGSKIGGYWCGTPDQPTRVFFGDWTTYPCDPHADISGTVTLTVLGSLALAGVLAGVLWAVKRASLANTTFLGVGLAFATSIGLAAAMLLPGLDNRAAAAAALNRPVQHNIADVDVAVAALAILGLAVHLRRRSSKA